MVQTELSWELPEQNLARFDKLIGEETDADLIVLPEMFSTGFSMASARLAEKMDGATVSWMQGKAKSLQATLCGSLIIEEEGCYFNRFIWMPADGKNQHYDKRHLFRMSSENDHYTGGNNKLVVELNGFRLCPQICYDLRFPVWSRNDCDFDLLLYVANWPAARREHWSSLLRARAIENLCYVVALNRIGVDGNAVEYSGDSVVVDYNGVTRLQMDSEDAISSIRLDKHALVEYRDKFPAYLDADQYNLTL